MAAGLSELCEGVRARVTLVTVDAWFAGTGPGSHVALARHRTEGKAVARQADRLVVVFFAGEHVVVGPAAALASLGVARLVEAEGNVAVAGAADGTAPPVAGTNLEKDKTHFVEPTGLSWVFADFWILFHMLFPFFVNYLSSTKCHR